MRGTKDERPKGSGRWRLRVVVGRNANGSPIYKTKTFVGTSRDADTELAKLVV
jgi:hypothetical protein